MAFTPFQGNTAVIESLHDRPNAQDGLDGEGLRKKFDEAATAIAKYINGSAADNIVGLLNELAASTAAANIGFSPVTGLNVTNLQAACEALLAAIGDGQELSVLDGSITAAKLSGTADSAGAAVTTQKIADGAVTHDKLDDEAVDYDVIADDAIRHDHIKGREIDHDNIALGGVWNENLATDAVHAGNILDGEIGFVKTDGTIQKKHATVPNGYITLANTGWDSNNRKSVSVTGVTASNTVFVSPWVNNTNPGRSNWVNIRDYGIRCVKQGAGTLMFECETVPPSTIEELWFSVVIFD